MTAISERYNLVIYALIGALVIQMAMAQRPSFAGSRPANGLSQKDKYLTTTVASPDVQNRFGDSDAPISNQVPFGQSQRPPVGLVVTPESNYVPLQNIRPETNDNGVAFQDRFGDGDVNAISSSSASSSASSSSSSSASASGSTTLPAPVDAHGDHQLINQLSKLPPDQQPFWFVNHKAIEAQRNGTVTNFSGATGSRGSFFG